MKKIHIQNYHTQGISKIISFDDYIFVFSHTQPIVSAFMIDENLNAQKCEINFNIPEIVNHVNNIQNVDATLALNGSFMFGLISAIKRIRLLESVVSAK